MDQKVLASVAGDKITQDEFDWFLKTLPGDRQQFVNNPQFREQCLQQLIALRLFAKMGESLELDKSEEYTTILENSKRDILAQMAMTQFMKDVVVSDEDVKKFYEEHTENFMKAPTCKAKHILTEKEEECTAILEAINNGEKTFEDAAKESSTCPSGKNGGQLGEFKRGQMVKEFEDAAFDAEIGKIVGPVKTQFGFHLLVVEAKTEAEQVPFDEVKDNIKRSLTQKTQNEAYHNKIEELKAQFETEVFTETEEDK